MKRGILFLSLIFYTLLIWGQYSEPNELKASFIEEKINFDGILSEKEWKNAQIISNFTQKELNYGEPASEKTQVSVLYNKNGLYFGINCEQKNAKIIAKSLDVDFSFWSEDIFAIMLSPFDDNRTGYLFIINPFGARADLQIFNFEDGSLDWNGVWDAKTNITDTGWTAEVFIPFNTLQFKRDTELIWALNFKRTITAKNEEDLWQGWSRDKSIMSVEAAGKLTGLKNIGYTHRFEFKPYILAGYQYDATEGKSYPLKAGGDINVYLTPSLKLNLTSFTDFAQVEVDRIPVNLSRFAVYYPEKRQFFLEGSNYFQFYLGDRNRGFYTRRIGIENYQQVPILGGARLFGKIGKSEIGFLNIQESALDTIPSVNNTVFRYKKEIGQQSYIGGIFTNKINKNGSNQMLGIDAEYRTSDFLNGKNLTLGVKTAATADDFKPQNNAYTYRIYSDYPNDLIDNFMSIGTMTENFDPQLGFIYRKNFTSYSWYFRLMPRVLQGWGIKRLLLKPWGFTLYKTFSTGQIESFYNETRPFGAVFKSGDRFEVNFIQNFDRPDEPFAITDEIIIPEGKYLMYKYELQLESYHGRKVSFFLLYNWGDFYTGKIKTWEFNTKFNFGKHLNLEEGYTYNNVNLPQGRVITHELASYMNLAFNTKLNMSLFIQYNSLENIFIYNMRVHWIPKIGSDFYFVITSGYNDPLMRIDFMKPQQTAVVSKLVYRITF